MKRTIRTANIPAWCLFFGMLMLLHACSEEQLVYLKKSEISSTDVIQLSANRTQIITRSGEESVYFEPGTLYRLFAANTPSNSGDYDWDNATFDDTRAEETESHAIDYGAIKSFPKDGSSLDFYGVTFGTTVDPNKYLEKEGSRKFTLALDERENSIPDMRYSTNLKAVTEKTSDITLLFKHALSSINFTITRQKTTNNTVNLSGLVLERIEVIEPKSEGTFNLIEGKWEYSNATKSAERVFYDRSKTGTEDQVNSIPEDSATPVPGEMCIFPNQGVKVRVTLSGYEGNEKRSFEYTVAQLSVDEAGNTSSELFQFEPNYKYTLAITLLDDKVMVLVIIPEKYDWIDVDLAEVDTYVGQPVTFNGIMWMDRNLGAKTADCENDFYGSIGYYYQHGRNIPFILDTDKFKHFINDDNKTEFAGNIYFITSDEENKNIAERIGAKEGEVVITENTLYNDPYSPYYYWRNSYENNTLSDEDKAKLVDEQLRSLYTFDHKGDTVYGLRLTLPEKALTDTNVIRFPGDVLYDEKGNVDDELTHEYYKFSCIRKDESRMSRCYVWTNFDGAKENKTYNGSNLWQDIDSQPCPKGWRLPTREDAEAFMPEIKTEWNKTWPKTYKKGDETVMVYGKVSKYYVIYMMKDYDTDHPYRVRIMSSLCTGSKNKNFIQISRFSAEKGRNLLSYLTTDDDKSNQKSTEWANPIESILFPCAGFIVTDCRNNGKKEPAFPDMRCFGIGSVLRTSDDASSELSSVVFYLAQSNYYVQIIDQSRRALGDQVRCVRDINTKDK